MKLMEWSKARGVTLTEVARRANVAYSTVHRGTRGEISRYPIAERISKETGGEVTVDDLCFAKRASKVAA